MTTGRATTTVEPFPLDEVIERVPRLRQSTLSMADDCLLAGLMRLRMEQGWSTPQQARGSIFHRVMAEILRTLKATNQTHIPTEEAMSIMREVLAQRDVAPEDHVRVPLREQELLRIDVIKAVQTWQWSPHKIMGIEKRLDAAISYTDDVGQIRQRTLTGQPDLLIAEPPDGAIICDYKTGWYVPPETPEDKGEQDLKLKPVSYRGWFQCRFYAWLVMRNYPAVQHVRFRELYPRKAVTRTVTVYRSDLEHVEHELADLAFQMDRLLAHGSDIDNPYAKPTPGKHCSYCPAPGQCPIPDEARGEGAITSYEMAQEYAADLQVASANRDHRTKALKAWVDEHGPVEVKSAKGRLMIGWVESGGRRSFKTFVPSDSDKGVLGQDVAAEVNGGG